MIGQVWNDADTFPMTLSLDGDHLMRLQLVQRRYIATDCLYMPAYVAYFLCYSLVSTVRTSEFVKGS